MHTLVRQVFYRLQSLNPEEAEERLRSSDDDSQNNEITMNVQVLPVAETVPVVEESSPDDQSPTNLDDPVEPLEPAPLATAIRSECAFVHCCTPRTWMINFNTGLKMASLLF